MKNLNKFYVLLALIAFGLNWIWEMVQMFAFELKTDDSRFAVLVFCTLAATVDALMTIGIYGLLARFISANRAIFYLFAAASGTLCAVAFEQFAFRFGLWNYSELMPVVPILKIGLLPLLQLMLLVPSAIWLAKKYLRKDKHKFLCVRQLKSLLWKYE